MYVKWSRSMIGIFDPICGSQRRLPLNKEKLIKKVEGFNKAKRTEHEVNFPS